MQDDESVGLYAFFAYCQRMLEPQLLPVVFLSRPPCSIGALLSMLLLKVGVILQTWALASWRDAMLLPIISNGCKFPPLWHVRWNLLKPLFRVQELFTLDSGR